MSAKVRNSLLMAGLLVMALGCAKPGKDTFTLTNANGMEVRAISYGGIITSIRVPEGRRKS